MAIAPRHSSEMWDLLNIPVRYNCYPKCLRAAQRTAKSRNIAILIRHHGPHHLEDHTRANQYVRPDGSVDIRRNETGGFIDAA